MGCKYYIRHYKHNSTRVIARLISYSVTFRHNYKLKKLTLCDICLMKMILFFLHFLRFLRSTSDPLFLKSQTLHGAKTLCYTNGQPVCSSHCFICYIDPIKISCLFSFICCKCVLSNLFGQWHFFHTEYWNCIMSTIWNSTHESSKSPQNQQCYFIFSYTLNMSDWAWCSLNRINRPVNEQSCICNAFFMV